MLSVSVDCELKINAFVSVSIVCEFCYPYEFQTREIDEELEEFEQKEKSKKGRDPTWPEWVKATLVRKIANLPCKDTIQDMILEGFPTVECARQIHYLGFAKDVSLSYLGQCVEHFRQTIPKALIINRLSPKALVPASKAMNDGINEVEEIADMYLKLKSIIEIGVKRTQQLDSLIPGLEKYFGHAATLLEKSANIKQSLGFKNNKPIEVQSTKIDWTSIYSRPGMNEVMSDPKARYRIVKFVESLASVYSTMSSEKQAKMLEIALRTIKKDMPKTEDKAEPIDEVKVVEQAIDEAAPIPDQIVPRKIINEEPVIVSRREPG